MRPGTTFSQALHNPRGSPSPWASPDGTGLHTAWRSPVPYLFGGLAAMLGLIALALLTLACAYWRLTGYLNSAGATGDQTNSHGGNGEGKGTAYGDAEAAPPVKEHVAVIMAGEMKPTHLATPAQKKDVDGDSGSRVCNNCISNGSNIVADVRSDLERGVGASEGDGNQESVQLNQQQLRRQ